MIAVSVIMPVYNAENFLKKSIESIQNQTLENIEIICVDDGSKDNSLDILESLEMKYGNIKIVAQENAGPGLARNTGMKYAEGEYIAFLDSDDIFLNFEALEKMYEVGVENNASLVGANLRRITQNYLIEEHYDFINSRFTYFTKYDIVKSQEYGIPFAFYKNIFKRSFLEEHNIEFPDLRFGEDPIFMVNVLANIDEFPTVPLDLYGYNHSIGGGVNEKITTFEKKYAYILHFKDIFDVLKENNLYSILLTYKNEFIDYLIYSGNMHDNEIKEILKDIFKNYGDYFDEDEYGFFLMDYIINGIDEDSFNDIGSSKEDLEEYSLIKRFLFEESSIDFNFIDLTTLHEFFKFSEGSNIDLSNVDVMKASFNQLANINSRIYDNQETLKEEVEDLENSICAPFFDKNAVFLRKFMESRIDIKNFGAEDNSIEIIECDDSTADITHPSWFNDEEGLGTIINSVKGGLNFSIKCINEGKLQLEFKGIDYKDKKNNRIPIYIDYKEIIINDKSIVDGSRVSWHDNPFIFTKDVCDGEILNVQVKWAPFTQESNIFLMTEGEKLLNNFYKARIDVKNSGDETNRLILIESDDPASNIYEPIWLNDENGIGSVVYSTRGDIDVSFKCVNDGDLEINFKSYDFRDKNKNKIPIFIDYTEIEVNGKNLIKGSEVTWHDKSYAYKQKVKDGEIINIKAKWKPLSSESHLNLIHDSQNSLNKYSESRIDIKNNGSKDNDILILKSDDSSLNLSNPKWFVDKKGKGYILTSLKGTLNLSFKCINDGNLEIGFRSVDCRDKQNRKIPIYIDYLDINVDGEKLIDGSTVLWHDNQLIFKKDVKDNQIINLQVKWRPLNEDSDSKNILNYLNDKDEELDQLKKDLEKLANENERLKELKEELLNSNSWKLTESLRRIKN